MIYRDILSAI